MFMEIERPEAPTPIEDQDIETFPPEDRRSAPFYSTLLVARKSRSKMRTEAGTQSQWANRGTVCLARDEGG